MLYQGSFDVINFCGENKAVPKGYDTLFQEYFYEDDEKTWLVLGDHHTLEGTRFIIAKSNDYTELFDESR